MRQKNITLGADERLIQLACAKALQENKTLNKVFCEWLTNYAGQPTSKKNYLRLMHKLKYVEVGTQFSRDELNEH